MMAYSEAYKEGFRKTAEKSGLDSNVLLKCAWKSTPTNEILLGLIPGMIPHVGPLSALTGTVSGLIADPSTKQREAKLNLLPGVSAHRISNRLKTQVVNQLKKHKVNGNGQLLSEVAGPMVPALLLAGLGAGIGYRTGDYNRQKAINALIGAGIGAASVSAADIVGAIIAGIKRRRTEKEQVLHDTDKSNITKNLLIPGVANYNRFKRLGRSQGDQEEK